MALMEIITSEVTFSNNVMTTGLMQGNDSNRVRDFGAETNVKLLQQFCKVQQAGISQTFSPLMHDNQSDLRFRHAVADNYPLLPDGTMIPMLKNDPVTFQLQAADAGGDRQILTTLMHYDMPNAENQALFSWEDIADLITHVAAFEVSCVSGAGGGYTGAAFINSGASVVKADRAYAILGYRVNLLSGNLGITGVDWGNLRLGGPADPDYNHITRSWFKMLSYFTGLKTIPVFKGNNAGTVSIDTAQDENAGTVITNIIVGYMDTMPPL